MSGTTHTPTKPVVVACNLHVLPFYGKRSGAAQRCVSTVMTVDIAHIAPEATFVGIPPHVFPFGLLESIIVWPLDASGKEMTSSQTTRIECSRLVMASTASSLPVAYGMPTCLTSKQLNVDQDAQHQDFQTVYDLSGHDFRFRAIAATTLLAMKIHFDSPAPAGVRIVFRGMNVLPANCTVDTAIALLAANKPVAFVLPPITPKQRFESAAASAAALRLEAQEVQDV